MPDQDRAAEINSNPTRSTSGVILAAAALGVVVLAVGIWIGRGSPDQAADLTGAAATGAEALDGSMAEGQETRGNNPPDAAQSGAQDGRAADVAGQDRNGEAAASDMSAGQSAGLEGSGSDSPDTDAQGQANAGSEAAAAAAESGEAGAAESSEAGSAGTYQVTWAETEIEGLNAAEQGNVGMPTFVWFHADWCHVCQEIKPTMVKMRDDYKSQVAFIKVNVDAEDAQAANRTYQVRGTPTFVLFAADGEKLTQFSGWPGEGQVAELLNRAATLQ